MGSGPPSGAGTLGAAAATNVLAKASIRTTALIVRFMGSLLTRKLIGKKSLQARAL